MKKATDPREKLADGQNRTAFVVTDCQVGLMHKRDVLLLHIPNHGTFAWAHRDAERIVEEMIQRINVLRERKKAETAAGTGWRMDTGPLQVQALDIRVADDGQLIDLMFKAGTHRLTLPLAPDRLAGLIEVLQKAAALAVERRVSATAKATRQ